VGGVLSVEFERSQCNKYSLEVAAEVPATNKKGKDANEDEED